MSENAVTGVYSSCGYAGKMPGHDDFVEGGGAVEARRALMDWATRGLRLGRNGNTGEFLDRFLTMPIWRFALAPGEAGPAPLAGLICPSTDRVGRPFPLMIVAPVGALDPARAARALSGWFSEMERALLAALDPDARMADLSGSLCSPPDMPPGAAAVSGVRSTPPALRPLALDPDGAPREDAASGTIWTTLGAVGAQPCGFAASGGLRADVFVALTEHAATPENPR